MINGSHYDGSTTFTNRMTYRYAVVSDPYKGKHLKPQDLRTRLKRKLRWKIRKELGVAIFE